MELTLKDAKRIYKSVPKAFQKELETAFGADNFRTIEYTDLKTFDDLCKACGTTEKEFDAKWDAIDIDETTKHFERMKIMYRAINGDWEHDTMDKSQYKWFPVFTVSPSGLDFSYSYYHYDTAYAAVGFPLCFESEAKSNYSGKQFIAMWQQFITGKKR